MTRTVPSASTMMKTSVMGLTSALGAVCTTAIAASLGLERSHIEIRPTPQIPCGSSRALARLRKRPHWRSRGWLTQCHRRQAIYFEHGLTTDLIAIPAIPCGSCRALARLRKRCVSRRKCQQCRRLRRLAGSRQLLPHFACVLAAAPRDGDGWGTPLSWGLSLNPPGNAHARPHLPQRPPRRCCPLLRD